MFEFRAAFRQGLLQSLSEFPVFVEKRLAEGICGKSVDLSRRPGVAFESGGHGVVFGGGGIIVEFCCNLPPPIQDHGNEMDLDVKLFASHGHGVEEEDEDSNQNDQEQREDRSRAGKVIVFEKSVDR